MKSQHNSSKHPHGCWTDDRKIAIIENPFNILFSLVWHKRETKQTITSCDIHYNYYRKAFGFSLSANWNFKGLYLCDYYFADLQKTQERGVVSCSPLIISSTIFLGHCAFWIHAVMISLLLQFSSVYWIGCRQTDGTCKSGATFWVV